MPRELQEIRTKLASFEANQQLIEQKDGVIWKLIQEKDNFDTYPSAGQFESDTNYEIQEWAKSE